MQAPGVYSHTQMNHGIALAFLMHSVLQAYNLSDLVLNIRRPASSVFRSLNQPKTTLEPCLVTGVAEQTGHICELKQRTAGRGQEALGCSDVCFDCTVNMSTMNLKPECHPVGDNTA